MTVTLLTRTATVLCAWQSCRSCAEWGTRLIRSFVRIGKDCPASMQGEAADDDLLSRFRNMTSVAPGPQCGSSADDITAVVLLYHKMGTVWWQVRRRVSTARTYVTCRA